MGKKGRNGVRGEGVGARRIGRMRGPGKARRGHRGVAGAGKRKAAGLRVKRGGASDDGQLDVKGARWWE
jgi:hypothetical protein